MARRLKVLVAEDDSLLRRTLVELLEMGGEIWVTAHVPNGQMAMELALVTRPDVVLTDIEMPKLDGIELTRLLKQQLPDTAVVILTKFDEDEKLFSAIRAGASGYVLKDSAVPEIKLAIQEAARGESHLNPSLVSRVLEEFNRVGQAAAQRKQAFAELTRRELEVLEMIASGKRNKAIADAFFISEKTVKTHVGAVLRKLQLNDRTQAALFAQKHGLGEM